MSKKAQGISLNVIIIAAIALLVLVILSVVFMTRMREYNNGVQDCKSNGGECTEQFDCDTASSQYTTLAYIHCDDNKVCCVPIK